MHKHKPWQLFLIIAVILLTIYNILPTVFYYSKPLKSPISENQADKIAKEIELRVNALEPQSLDWLESYNKLLQIKAQSIELNKDFPEHITLTFKTLEEANKFRKYFPKAGALIPFVPAQMSLLNLSDAHSKTIVIQRQIPIHFDTKNINEYFEYTKKFDENNHPTAEYKKLIFDRAASLGVSIGGASEVAIKLTTINENPSSSVASQLTYSLAQDIIEYSKVFGENSAAAKRFFGSFSQTPYNKPSDTIKNLSDAFSRVRDSIKMEKIAIDKETDEAIKNEKLNILDVKDLNIVKAQKILRNHSNDFINGQTPWSYENLIALLKGTIHETSNEKITKLDVGEKNPIIKEIVLDWSNEKILLKTHDDLQKTELSDQKEIQQLIINEIARITNLSDENITKSSGEFSISFNSISGSKSLLILKLEKIAATQAKNIKEILHSKWNPSHEELITENFPIYDYQEYLSLPDHEKTLCFVVYSPALHSNKALHGLRQSSIYIMAKGLDRIIKKYQNSNTSSSEAELFMGDFNRLREILRQNGYIGYPGAHLPISSEFTNDFIFEKDDYYKTILKATREDFNVYGSKKYAILEFSDLEQRILTTNKIDTKTHEDLIKWKDEYNSAQVSVNKTTIYDVPAPTENILIGNIVLSAKKYLRGDERKILNWGLDLSGGKSVQLELRNQNNKVVKDEIDLKQGVNELYNRVNKMGVSDVSIKIVDKNIVLDFPGAQNLSAAELIKASSMYFHVVNEKFSSSNPLLADNVNRFLQEIWNEAIVTNRKDLDSINAIAWKHLYGDSLDVNIVQPRSEAAKILYDNGLRLAPIGSGSASDLDNTLSKISMFRGKEFTKWEGQTNPLLIIFNNYVLEGSSLTNVRSSYDPSKGNFLSFEVKGSQIINGKKVNCREVLHDWTSMYSKEKVAGTPLGKITHGRGWRMAVILNDSVISAPNLESALRDKAMITGSFTQREVTQLVADLKAGSLSFTPHILSEKNVSPELGQKERSQGIVAMFVALLVVFGSMVGYYRFAGLVASIAVVFNLLIMWATLQNIQATLSLAGIAGIILTVGMAVDANVLVFERIKEEFAITGRIASAVQSGYKKAFSAILDSNITTIIAALILLNFDAGPIKGFAITLIIGIASSMFSALFMTRFFFTKWVANPKHTKLTMSNLIKKTNFNFLKNAKFIYSSCILLILIGFLCFAKQGKSVMGMDFTGGFALNIELEDSPAITNYRSISEKAFEDDGANTQDFQIRELNTPNNLSLLFGTSMELSGKPFYNMPIATDSKDIKYPYENNPRIKWVVSALESKGLQLTKNSLQELDKSWATMSGQMSESMRNNALLGLGLAFLAIFIYITWRFEFKFAISAILCLVHDVLITIGSVAILHLFKVPVQIDMHTVAALMTIIGYSLNDTIIIFDRIREDTLLMRKHTFTEIVNHSLSVTLSRTTITSLSTIFVLLSLVFLGGSTIFSFALVMTLGVIFGTISSLFIASPLMLIFHKIERKKNNKKMIKE